MIAVTTASRIGGYYVAAYKGTAEGETYGELLKSAGCYAGVWIPYRGGPLRVCVEALIDVFS
jgi:hypothetical protein